MICHKTLLAYLLISMSTQKKNVFRLMCGHPERNEIDTLIQRCIQLKLSVLMCFIVKTIK
jgi:hypothetical protein